jgi:ABC-type polysaccharide/polyol phosphate export permease
MPWPLPFPRALFVEQLRRELRTRWTTSLLGGLWPLLQPVAQLAVLALVFTHLLPARAGSGQLPYAAFLALGLWPWQLFANAVNGGTLALVDQASLLGKLNLPHGMFVLVRVLGSVLPDLLGFALVLLCVAAFAQPPASPAALAWLLPGVALVLLWALALARALASIQVFLRDASTVVGQLLVLGFFLSPVLYDRHQLSPGAAAALGLNPLAAPIEAVRAAWGLAPPSAAALLGSLGAGLVALARRARPHVEDFL